jgi:hypothetical protein
MLYSKPAPIGLVIVIIPLPKPREQSTLCRGAEGDGGMGFITAFPEKPEVQPTEFVTVKV